MRTSTFHRLSILPIMISFVISLSLVAQPTSVEASPQAATKQVLYPLADSYVKANAPDTNYGTDTQLRARSAPDLGSYLRFSVGDLAGLEIIRAVLKLYVTSSSAYGLKAKVVSDDSWGETTITYNNMPALGKGLNLSPAVTAGTWVSLNVTSYIKAAGTYTIGVVTPGSTPISFASRESGANAPTLTLTVAPPDVQPSFPIRATFYYPWFPQAWEQHGIYPYTNYTPSLGFYSSTDSSTLQRHIDMMQYANIQVGIASWWGQGSQTDTKIPGLLTAAAGTNFRWSLYYEPESQGDPSPLQIYSDLLYIRNHYGQDPSFFRVNRKFVVFVYATGSDGCGMADRWKQANLVGAYIVLKVFPGYANCASQPNSWHQYSPAVAADEQGTFSYAISPGFWHIGQNVVLARNITRWTRNVKGMVASGAKWQLVTTFSEWGEGTAVEPALDWPSTSGYGQYLDVLHYNGIMP